MLFTKNQILFFATICFFLIQQYGFAQIDSTKIEVRKNHNIIQLALNAITKKLSDSAAEAALLNVRSEVYFLPYQGKIIRRIIIKRYGFDKIFSDTSTRLSYLGTKILNSLHTNTREEVIRNNLFIKEKTSINAYKLADNERYLRSLEFMQDARIIINDIPNITDSVDLLVITKDLFSITGDLSEVSKNRFQAKIGEANFLGMGQKIQLSTLIEQSRKPTVGFEFLYSKNSIAHSFINANIVYTTINPSLNNGLRNEHAWYIQLERPLVSQYAHFAGALLVGQNQSYNNYQYPDSSFYRYNYYKYDMWLGYNLGVNALLNNTSKKDRQFIGLRYFQNSFAEVPYQIKDPYNFKFSNRQALLGQFTFFRQHFYKTNYIYGFGTTEDVPAGYNIALTAGWYKQANLKRTYTDINANYYVATHKGDFIQYFTRAGTFIHNGQWQDAGFLLGANVFSRLFVHRSLKIRQYIGLSYTRLFNITGIEPLRIDNAFGLRYFNADSITGTQRISLHTETFFFLKYKLLGFKFAPFAFGEATLLTPPNQKFASSDLYYNIGSGVRTRNENLIFETIELRFIYFPRKAAQNNSFKIAFTTNIRFRYNSNYVNAPDIVQFNNDNNNNIY